MGRKILIVEDNADIARLVALHLGDLGWEVTLAEDGPSGLAKVTAARFDLVILDLMLPGMEGLEVCKRLRAREDYTPILMLTARSSETDRVVGLEVGADDYLVKPFGIAELIARVKALLRRVEAFGRGNDAAANSAGLNFDGMVIDTDKRLVSVNGTPVDLTAKEFNLLLQFAQNPGRVYTRSQLLDLVWGYGHDGYEHTVNSHINRLRAKIERDAAKPRYILTVWGVGYKFNDALSV